MAADLADVRGDARLDRHAVSDAAACAEGPPRRSRRRRRRARRVRSRRRLRPDRARSTAASSPQQDRARPCPTAAAPLVHGRGHAHGAGEGLGGLCDAAVNPRSGDGVGLKGNDNAMAAKPDKGLAISDRVAGAHGARPSDPDQGGLRGTPCCDGTASSTTPRPSASPRSRALERPPYTLRPPHRADHGRRGRQRLRAWVPDHDRRRRPAAARARDSVWGCSVSSPPRLGLVGGGPSGQAMMNHGGSLAAATCPSRWRTPSSASGGANCRT